MRSTVAIRAWINQPSTHDHLHQYHGTRVLAILDTGGIATVYFLSGDIISMRVPTSVLAIGWVFC